MRIKKISDSNPSLAELKRVFDVLNKSLFNKQIRACEFSIQPKKKFGLRWHPDSKSIILGCDFVKMDSHEFMHNLLHEMVHIYNFQQEIVDVTTNQYHNKHFLECALNVGLVVIKHKTQGWAITSTAYPRNVTERIFIRKPSKQRILKRNEVFSELKINQVAFKNIKTQLIEAIKTELPAKTFFLKYECECPPPHNSIRSGRRPDGPNALNIKCMNCNAVFTCVSDFF